MVLYTEISQVANAMLVTFWAPSPQGTRKTFRINCVFLVIKTVVFTGVWLSFLIDSFGVIVLISPFASAFPFSFVDTFGLLLDILRWSFCCHVTSSNQQVFLDMGANGACEYNNILK